MGWGVLENTHPLRKSMLVYVAPEKPYSASDYEAMQGEKEFSSTMPEAEGLNLKVSGMTIFLKNSAVVNKN